MKHNPNNERIKRKYMVFLKDAKGQSEASIDGVAMAINRFENYTRFKDFKNFNHEQARGFKKHLAKQTTGIAALRWKLSCRTVASQWPRMQRPHRWSSLKSSSQW